MTEIEIRLNENWLVIPLFIIILGIHLIPLVRHSIPVTWDAGFYFFYIAKNINPIENNLEPLYFIFAQGLKNIFSVFLTMKIIQFTSFTFLLLGTYMFTKKYFGIKTALVIMLLIGMIPATSRIYSDQYRNMLSLTFLPFFLYSSLKDNKRYALISGIFLGLIGLSHRLVLIYACASYGLYAVIRLFMKDTSTFKRALIVFLIAGIIASPFLLRVFLPTTGEQADVLLKWEMPPMNFVFTVEMTVNTIIFSLMAILLAINKKDKKSYFLLSFFIFATISMFGLLGTPFLIYERYLLMFCLIAILFSAIYFKELFDIIDKEPNIIVWGIFIFSFVLIFTMSIEGYKYINKGLVPFVTEQELDAFRWINNSLTRNSTILIPSRGHYWIAGFTDMNIVPMEWYELLGQREPTDESIVLVGDIGQSDIAIQNLKQKYNTTSLYIFFNLEKDPVFQPTSEGQEIFMIKTSIWNETKSWGNAFLYKI